MQTNRPLVSRSIAVVVVGLLLSVRPGLCGEAHAVSPTVDAVIAYAKSDYAKALELLTPLAKQREVIAQLLLGRMYSQGEGVPSNNFTALELYRRAAEQGNIDAQFELGIMYRDGLGTTVDGKIALYWFKRVADRGLPHAYNAIGELHLGHQDVPPDYIAAIEWFRRSAELDSAAAMYNIGVLYALGRGVDRDEIEAFMWFDLAAATDPGDDKAVRARIALAERLMPLQVWEAKINAEKWLLGSHCCSPNTEATGGQVAVGR